MCPRLAFSCAESGFSVSMTHGLPCREMTDQPAPAEGTTDMDVFEGPPMGAKNKGQAGEMAQWVADLWLSLRT